MIQKVHWLLVLSMVSLTVHADTQIPPSPSNSPSSINASIANTHTLSPITTIPEVILAISPVTRQEIEQFFQNAHVQSFAPLTGWIPFEIEGAPHAH